MMKNELALHRSFCLVLLHSCPDTVHRFLLRKTQTSTPLFRGSPTVKTPSVGQHPCYSGLQVQGTANSPAVRKLYDLILYDGMTCRPSACLVYMAAAVLSSRSLTNKHCIKIHKNTFYCFFIIFYPRILQQKKEIIIIGINLATAKSQTVTKS